MDYTVEDSTEALARFLAERFKAIESRREDEPVDVCRFHRDIADDIVGQFLGIKEMTEEERERKLTETPCPMCHLPRFPWLSGQIGGYCRCGVVTSSTQRAETKR